MQIVIQQIYFSTGRIAIRKYCSKWTECTEVPRVMLNRDTCMEGKSYSLPWHYTKIA